MTKVRVERDRRVSGARRVRLYLLAALALLGLALTAGISPALSSSGRSGAVVMAGARLAGPGGGGVSPGGAGASRVAHSPRPARKIAHSRPPSRKAAHPPARKAAPSRPPASKATVNPFAGRAMWIWVLSMSNGGNLSSIIATARRYRVNTLMIKSGDGSGTWSQFTPQLVATLHAAGLRVCAWQYVYGTHPISEAQVGAAAVKDGADCLLIDAETEYEGKYVSAQTYVSQLRRRIGASFPVALAGFPYVDYHPAFPYSVFLGPGGAQYNVPQMYWVDIGTTVDLAYAHTFVFNQIYQRPIFPLGQLYNHPPPSQVVRFRQLSRAYGAPGVSWWDWQEATYPGWRAISRPAGPPAGFTPDASLASVGSHAQGDLVVWAQEHLYAAGHRTMIDGAFGPQTRTAVRRFQTAQGLRATGSIDPATWRLLLRYAPVRVHWGQRSAAVASAASASGTTPVPKSASLRPVRNEIAGAGGAGRPRR